MMFPVLQSPDAGLAGDPANQTGLVRQVVQKPMGSTWWPYVVLFLTVTVSWAGVPAVGPAAIGAATVAASQNKLDLTAVVAVSVLASEIGGICGYAIGRRWGTRLMERPGPHQARRKRVAERGERLYARWGGLAVFFTPGIVSGTARMSPYRFAFWNLLASFAWTASVVASTYGVSKLVTGPFSWHDLASLIAGLGVAALVIYGLVRRRRRTARRPAAVAGEPSRQ
jgi:membrane-associated protein